MFLMTTHRTFVGQTDKGQLIQVKPGEPGSSFVNLETIDDQATIADGPLSGYTVRKTERGINLERSRQFLCADPHDKSLIADRDRAGAWETFVPIDARDMPAILELYVSPQTEMRRFKERVAEMRAAGEPIKIYCGCGDIVRDGFLHIDIVMMAPLYSLEHPQNYFIFPFVDMPWDIPDACIDYIFHEDFIEHIDQLQQIQFLAETRRVLKNNSWHRVNSPNLIATMRRNSDFERGFEGVYIGEKTLWGHVVLLTNAYLKEIAELVGYREVRFTPRSEGSSPYAVEDFRPLSDRDSIDGNVFADLRK